MSETLPPRAGCACPRVAISAWPKVWRSARSGPTPWSRHAAAPAPPSGLPDSSRIWPWISLEIGVLGILGDQCGGRSASACRDRRPCDRHRRGRNAHRPTDRCRDICSASSRGRDIAEQLGLHTRKEPFLKPGIDRLCPGGRSLKIGGQRLDTHRRQRMGLRERLMSYSLTILLVLQLLEEAQHPLPVTPAVSDSAPPPRRPPIPGCG